MNNICDDKNKLFRVKKKNKLVLCGNIISLVTNLCFPNKK